MSRTIGFTRVVSDDEPRGQSEAGHKIDGPAGADGVFKSIDEVSNRYRLSNFSKQFGDRDVWKAYTDDILDDDCSEGHWERAERAGRRWKEHMAKRGRHHALATPDDVDVYFETVLETNALRTAYMPYWVRLNEFYDWLLWHTEYPHVYQPVLMAAANGEHVPRLWEFIIDEVR